MIHSPKPRSEAPNHEDINTPTKKMKLMDVTNPRPAEFNVFYKSEIGLFDSN